MVDILYFLNPHIIGGGSASNHLMVMHLNAAASKMFKRNFTSFLPKPSRVSPNNVVIGVCGISRFKTSMRASKSSFRIGCVIGDLSTSLTVKRFIFEVEAGSLVPGEA